MFSYWTTHYSGSIAERMKFSSWVIFTVIWSTIVYDLVAHMVWAAYPVENSDGTTTVAFGWLRAIGAIVRAATLASRPVPFPVPPHRSSTPVHIRASPCESVA